MRAESTSVGRRRFSNATVIGALLVDQPIGCTHTIFDLGEITLNCDTLSATVRRCAKRTIDRSTTEMVDVTTTNASTAKVDPSELRYVPLDHLLSHVNPRNPKDHDVGDILASILRHGFVGYVTFDPSVEMMVAGHGRLKGLKAARDMGAEPPARIIEEFDAKGQSRTWMVPTYFKVFANQHERDAYTIGDNQTTIKGGWMIDDLTNMLEGLARTDPEHGLDGTGYDMDDLDQLLADKDFEPPPPPPPPELQVQYGILIRVGNKVQESALADLLEKHGWEKFLRLSEDA
jgi:hypothetical protein